jgi:ribonuclease HII
VPARSDSSKPPKATRPVKVVEVAEAAGKPSKVTKSAKAVEVAKAAKAAGGAAKVTRSAKAIEARQVVSGPAKVMKPGKQVKAASAQVQPVSPRAKTKSKVNDGKHFANTATSTETTKSSAPAIMRPSKKPTKKTPPNLKVEQSLWADGHEIIVGIDEVGRGSWAGPLSIGAVVLPKSGRVNGVRDSKMLTEREREALFDRVAGGAQHWAIGSVSHDECDRIGMSAAQKLAAQRAIEGLGLGFDKIDRVLIDGNWDFVSEFLGEGKTQRIIKGDATCLTIASASVLAKVSRDRLMRAYDPEFPGFNFAENKGYPCPKHKMALQAYGPTAIHRRSWVFMDHLPWTGVPRIVPQHLASGVSVDQEVLF